jgi:hypothetical protein
MTCNNLLLKILIYIYVVWKVVQLVNELKCLVVEEALSRGVVTDINVSNREISF